MKRALQFFVPELLFLVIAGISTSNAEEPLVEPPAQRDVTTYFDELAKSSPMTLEWSADSVEEHHAWQEKFRARLVQLLGRMPDSVPLEVKWTERRDFEKFIKFSFLSNFPLKCKPLDHAKIEAIGFVDVTKPF